MHNAYLTSIDRFTFYLQLYIYVSLDHLY